MPPECRPRLDFPPQEARHQGHAVADAELSAQPLNVILDRSPAHRQLPGDLPGPLAAQQPLKHLPAARGQVMGVRHRRQQPLAVEAGQFHDEQPKRFGATQPPTAAITFIAKAAGPMPGAWRRE